ncbi:MAG: FecR domain-containing protein [Burkholderiales bacterium]|nr:FecR domain-containing protein [Burkholderiales bacterium]
MKHRLVAVSLFLLAGASAVAAAPTAVVEGVQMPAWVERGGSREPLAPGMELRPADRITTGANSRLLLRLAEGSQVKLGENAQLSLERLAQTREDRQTLLSAALDVARGAFRFTTDARARLTSRRAVDIRVATVTAGIRGTDLWGKSAADRDIVCLIEGRIAVQREGGEPVSMDQALQFYIAPKANGRPDASRPVQLATVTSEQLAQWAAETEIAAGQGAARRGGRWKLIAAEAAEQGQALAVYDKLRAEGYAATIFPTGSAEKRVYQVRLTGLASKAEAEALGARIEAIAGGRGRAAL